MKAFIQDKERVLSTVNDLLKTSIYAENLVKVIENTPKDKVFTIGVFGGWGTGKSSIIRTAQETVEVANKDVKFITYDAWKYANDSFRRMFLLKIQQELRMPQTEEMNRFYQSEIVDAEPKMTLSAKRVALAVIVVAIISIILFLTPISIEWKVAVSSIGTLGTFLLALLNGLFYDLKISYSKPTLFAPEQFEACFKDMMSKCLKRKNWIQKTWDAIKDYVTIGDASVVGLEKLVIVIDNIDRCPSDLAYQLLTDVKTFLSNEDYNLVFIVPVDDDALKKHLFRRWKQANDGEVNKEKEEFLRKFFNVTLRIKPHQETELLYFTHEINKENGLGYSNETLAIVAKEFADNPRRIIQLLNNLSGDLALYDDNFATKYETAICAALILREEYPTFYKEVTRDLNLVKKFSEGMVTQMDEKTHKSLIDFMRVADISFKQTPLADLQRIFTNTSSIFSDLPADVQKAVITYDAAKVIEFADNNDTLKTNVVGFALDKLGSEIKYGAINQTSKWIDFLSHLFNANIFDSSRFNTINALLSTYYKEAIPVIDDQILLNNLGSHMNKAGYPALRTAVLDSLKDAKSLSETQYEALLTGYLVNYTSENDCEEIAEVVDNHYLDHPINEDFEYTDSQIQRFFGDSYLTTQIENITGTDDKVRLDNITWCFTKNKKLSGKTYSALFSKLIELFGKTRGKSKENYLLLIQDIQSFLDVIDTAKLSTELQSLYDLVTRPRAIPNPNWPTQTQRDTHSSILDELNDTESEKVTKFCYDIMRISGGNVDISNSISKLYSKNKDAVIEGALKINALGISLKPLAATLIQTEDFDSDNNIALLRILLTRQEDGGMLLDEEIVKDMIHKLTDHSANANAESLLKNIITDKQILSVMADYVATLDSETINSLPLTISRYAVSTFNRCNVETFKNNTAFLILVLKKGTDLQKKLVVNLMKNKINNEEDLDSVVVVLDNFVTQDQRTLRILVSELEGLLDSDSVVEEEKTKIKTLVNKLSASIGKSKVLKKKLSKK